MKHSKSSLVLMELIIVILFFSLASTVCIQLFAKSHLLSSRTVNENHAVIHAQNLAECFLATEGDVAQIKTLFETHVSDTPENTVLLLFDGNWKECSENDACYSACLVTNPEAEGLLSAEITISAYPSGSEDSIYTLTVLHHIPKRRADLD